MKFIFSILFILSALSCTHNKVTISNIDPRTDINGNIVDAHDGRIIKFGGKFYWYGTSYGNTNGFSTSNFYSCYSSSDLTNWKPEGKLIPDAPEGVYYRPHVIFNKATKKYVLWYNWYPTLWTGQFGVATSDNPEGPFKIENLDVKVKHTDKGVGDLNLFVDDDETAYLVYNTITDHLISVDKLSPDYLSSTLENSGFIVNNSEANALFKREGKYYVLTDVCCCFCGDGSGVGVYMSDNPLGNYILTGNINRYQGSPVFSVLNGQTDPYDFISLNSDAQNQEKIDLLLRENMEINKIKVEIAWKNYRTNCSARGDDTTRYADNINPEIVLQYKKNGDWITFDIQPEIDNKVVLLEYTFTFPQVSTTQFRIQPGKTVYSPVNITEISLFNNEKLIGPEEITAYKLKNSVGEIIIPAQQTCVMEVPFKNGVQYIWMGDLWGSRPDNIKGHDFQFWSKPLEFLPDGTIKQLEWVDEYTLELE